MMEESLIKKLIQVSDRILAKTCISIVQNEFGKN